MNGNRRFVAALRALGALTVFVAPCADALAKNRKGVEADLQAHAGLEYTDNLLHFSEEDIDDFGTAQAPGQQFFDLEEPEDLVLHVGLGGDWRFDRGEKRELRLAAGGTYHAHMYNGVADYPELDLLAAYDLTQRDRIFGEANFIIDRFRKNLRIANTLTYAPAEYDQVELTAGYEREIGKRWSAGGELRLRDREYGATFEARDQDGVYVRGFTEYRIRERFWGESALELGQVDTGTEVDAGIPVDRSYDQYLIAQDFRWKLPSDFEIEAGIELRRRDYTTNQTTDLGRYSREDDRWGLHLGLEKELDDNLVLEGRVAMLDNDSSQIDPLADADETGYDETTVSFGLRYAR